MAVQTPAKSQTVAGTFIFLSSSAFILFGFVLLLIVRLLSYSVAAKVCLRYIHPACGTNFKSFCVYIPFFPIHTIPAQRDRRPVITVFCVVRSAGRAFGRRTNFESAPQSEGAACPAILFVYQGLRIRVCISVCRAPFGSIPRRL